MGWNTFRRNNFLFHLQCFAYVYAGVFFCGNHEPFASINPTNPRTSPWNFGEIFFRIGSFENPSFFVSAMKISQSFLVNKDGSKFLWLPCPKQHLRKHIQHSAYLIFFWDIHESFLVLCTVCALLLHAFDY